MLSALLLAGCSSVPDAVNPVEWYRGAVDWVSGDDKPAAPEPEPAAGGDFPSLQDMPEKPRVLSPEERKDIVEGLIGDRENARYTQERVNRQGTPTRPLPPAQPRPEAPQAAPVPAPAPPAPAGPTSQAPASAAAPSQASAPPSLEPGPTVTATLPEKAMPLKAVPPSVPPPAAPQAVQARPAASLLEDAYRRRLQESASQAPVPAPVVTPPPAAPVAAPPPATPRLVAPPAPLQPAQTGPLIGSGPVATVGFAGKADSMTRQDFLALRRAAELLRDQTGTVRVVGYAPSTAPDTVETMLRGLDVAMRRANAVARQLAKYGVPAARIAVEAEATTGPAGAEVYLAP